MDKKSLIAIALIAALWVGYFIVFKPASPVKKPAETKVETAQKEDGEIKKGGPAPVRIEQVAGDATEKQVIVKTKKFSVTLSNRGAAITGCTYLERNIDLIVKDNPYNAKGRLDFSISFDDDEFVNGSALNSALWMLRQNGNQVTFVTDIQMNGNPVRIEKTYLFKDDGYGFTVEYRLKNNGGKVIAFKNGSAIFSPGEILGPNLNYTNSYNRLMSIYSKEGSFKKADKGGSGFLLGCGSSSSDEPLKKEAGTINWAGIMSRYFLLIMMPSEGAGKGVMYDNKKQSGFRTGMLVSLNNLDAGKEVKRTFKVYLGEKDKKKLAAMDK